MPRRANSAKNIGTINGYNRNPNNIERRNVGDEWVTLAYKPIMRPAKANRKDTRRNANSCVTKDQETVAFIKRAISK
ncbi:MAG: hypothetical protein STSR0002_22880 [Smithella sp.]